MTYSIRICNGKEHLFEDNKDLGEIYKTGMPAKGTPGELYRTLDDKRVLRKSGSHIFHVSKTVWDKYGGNSRTRPNLPLELYEEHLSENSEENDWEDSNDEEYEVTEYKDYGPFGIAHLPTGRTFKVKKSEGCFIATQVYGESAEQTKLLRRFRDETLIRTCLGRLLINTYYRLSPSVSDFISDKPRLKLIIKRPLDMIISFL